MQYVEKVLMGGFALAPEVWQNGEDALTRASEKVDDEVANHKYTRLVLTLKQASYDGQHM
jgi:hypothetical protein